eukprot:UN23671
MWPHSEKSELDGVLHIDTFCCCESRFCDTLSIAKKIGVSTFLVLLVSVVSMGVLTISLAKHFESESTYDVSNALKDEELIQLTRITDGLAEYLDEYFEQLDYDALLLAKLSKEVYEGTLYEATMSTLYDGLNESISNILDSSIWWRGGEETISNLSSDEQDDVNKLSVLDFFLAGIHRTDTYIVEYYGTENGVFREYPWKDLDGFKVDKFDQYVSNVCEEENHGWYEPRCRTWYRGARSKSEGAIFYTDPYNDASSNSVCITVATPVKYNGSLKGVVGTDPYIQTL